MQAVPTSIPEGTRQPTGALRGRDRSADFGNAAGFVRRSQSGSKPRNSRGWRAAERTSDNVAPLQMRALTVRTGKICYQ